MYKNYSELGIKPEQNTDQYSVLEIMSLNERKELINTNRLVCIDIYAEWCGPCKQTAPAYSVLAKKYNKPNICAMVKLNWDKVDPNEREEITGIPVFLFYLDGKHVGNVVGADLKQVEEKINEYLTKISSGPDNSRGPQHNKHTIRNNRPQNSSESFNNPQQAFGAGQQGFNTPQQAFGAGQQGFNTPQQAFGTGQQGFNTPQQAFGNGQQGFNSPQQAFGNGQQGFHQNQGQRQGFHQNQQHQQGFNQNQGQRQSQQGFNQNNGQMQSTWQQPQRQ